MATPTYPGVYIQELPSAVHPITGVATSITAFVGYTSRGIDNRAEQVFSFSDYQRLFGGLALNSELGYAVQQFFQNGGTEAWVVRVPKTGASAATVVFAGLTFTALSSGVWADGQLIIDVDTNGLPATASSTAFNLTITNLVDGTVESFPNVCLDNTLTNYVANVVNDYDNGSQLVSVAVGSSATNTPIQSGVVGNPIVMTALDNALAGAGGSIGNVTFANNSAVVAGAALTQSLVGQSVTFACDAAKASYLVQSVTGATTLTLATPAAITSVTTTTAGSGAAAVPGTVTVTVGSPLVTGAGFTAVGGETVTFVCDGQATPTSYKVAAAPAPTATSLTLTKNFNLTKVATSANTLLTTATASFGLSVNVSWPASLAPFPIDVSFVSSGAPIPQSVSGLAAQLQRAINGILAVQLPGSSVQVSVSGTGAAQALRINALLPQYPDAVLTFGAPASPTLSNASAVLGLSGAGAPASANVAHYALGTTHGIGSPPASPATWGGQQISSQQGSDGTGLPATAALIGDQSLFQGIYALEKVDEFDILSIPDATRSLPGNPAVLDSTVDPNSIFSAALTYCVQRRAFLLIDPPPFVNTVSAAVDWITSGLTVTEPGGHAAAYFPRLRLPDPVNNYQLRTFAPSGVVAGLYARTDTNRGVWKAPAGIEATLTGVQSLVYKLTDAENGVLNPLGLNCFRTFPVYGTISWGARTIVGADADASQWKYVPVRRVASFIESSLYQGTQWVVFEPNDEPLWSAIRLNVGSFMQNLFIQGYFQGQTPTDAYFVKCDSEPTTQTDIDNGIVNIVVGFAPLLPAEFVIIQIQQIAGQTGN